MRPFVPQRGGPSSARPEIALRLPAAVEAPYLARRRLDELGAYLPRDRLEDARLLVSELVTNALRHTDAVGEEAIGLRAEATSEAVHVEVSDPGSGFTPPPRPVPRPTPDAATGRGLYSVDRLSDRWGMARTAGESAVWFEIDRRG